MNEERQREIERRRLLAAEAAVKEIGRTRRENLIDTYHPYVKQQVFHDLGLTKRERLLRAGNQNGKTFCGGAETSYHLTGRYPDWWLGRRWERPTRGWVAGVTGESTRDNPQRILLGTIANISAYGPGTGMIPMSCIKKEDMTLARGVSDLYDTCLVQHYGPPRIEIGQKGSATIANPDGKSEFKFKSYEKGRDKWQGDTLDWIWYDEEPPWEIYDEGIARITATNGMVFITFTPAEGMTKVVIKFLEEKSPYRAEVSMTIDDALHIPKSERDMIIAGYDESMREARARGEPISASGQIFKYTESSIKVQDFPIPANWNLLNGLDFGTQHPFAAALIAWDKLADVIYVVRTMRMKNALPLQHAAAIKPWLNGFGGKIPCAWPQDGWQREDFDGKLKPLRDKYKYHGLNMLPDHAKFEDGSNSTEIGIQEMQDRMSTGRFKVFASCVEWFEEYRKYHKRQGEIVRIDDDLMSATRVAVMARRFARAVLWEPGSQDGGSNVQMAKDVDIDPWM